MRRFHLAALAGALLLASAFASSAGECACGPQTVDDLKRMSEAELMALFQAAGVGRPLDGTAKGKLVYLAGRNLKMRMASLVWTGKRARASDGWFINRWLGGVELIASHYVIGPSWVDGKPAILMDYAPKTPLLGNVHDELREIAPGLYLGPVFEKCPCPRFRGFVAVQVQECGCK